MNNPLAAAALKVFKGELVRSRVSLIPTSFAFLWTVTRFLVAYGGRASGKSWSTARVILVLLRETPLRCLCVREIQSSTKESAYRLFCDQIEQLGLSDFYQIGANSITGKNGSQIFFEGLHHNTVRIRSYESIDIVFVEEAQNISSLSVPVGDGGNPSRGRRVTVPCHPCCRWAQGARQIETRRAQPCGWRTGGAQN